MEERHVTTMALGAWNVIAEGQIYHANIPFQKSSSQMDYLNRGKCYI